jgi:hypothetical protein
MMMKGPVRELLPVGAQRVRVNLPEGTAVRGVRLLVADAPAEFRQEGSVLDVTVPSITVHEVLGIDV